MSYYATNAEGKRTTRWRMRPKPFPGTFYDLKGNYQNLMEISYRIAVNLLGQVVLTLLIRAKEQVHGMHNMIGTLIFPTYFYDDDVSKPRYTFGMADVDKLDSPLDMVIDHRDKVKDYVALYDFQQGVVTDTSNSVWVPTVRFAVNFDGIPEETQLDVLIGKPNVGPTMSTTVEFEDADQSTVFQVDPFMLGVLITPGIAKFLDVDESYEAVPSAPEPKRRWYQKLFRKARLAGR